MKNPLLLILFSLMVFDIFSQSIVLSPTSDTQGRLNIVHGPRYFTTDTHINLRTTNPFGPVTVRYENNNGTLFFLQSIAFNSSIPTLNTFSWSFNGTSPILSFNGDKTVSVSGDLRAGGYATLGSDGPSIKMKTFTTTTGAAEGGIAEITHGLDANKIISVEVLVEASVGVWIKNAYTFNAGKQFDVEYNGTKVRILNHPTNSENILSKSCKALVTYTK